MRLTLILRSHLFHGPLPSAPGPFDEPHVEELRLRMFLLKQGMSEDHAIKVLGLEKSILARGGGALHHWITQYPVRPNRSLWLFLRRDNGSNKMVLTEAYIEENQPRQ